MVDFLVIGSINAMFYKNVAKLFIDDKINVGNNMLQDFEDGKKVAAYWYSSFYVQKDPIELKCVYDKNKYYKYINYDAINIDNINDIPMNYDEVVGVPGTFMFSYDKRQFKIVSFSLSGNNMITIKEDDDVTKKLKLLSNDWRLHHPVILEDGNYIYRYYRVFIKKK